MFEITESLSVVVEGQIRPLESLNITEVTVPECSNRFILSEEDFYKEMRFCGYYHKGLFRAIRGSRYDGKVKWNANWATFIDCLLPFQVLTSDTRMVILPTKLKNLKNEEFTKTVKSVLQSDGFIVCRESSE